MVGWGIAAAAAVHHVHVRVHDLRSRRAECAAAYTRRARAGTAKEKKGTNNPGSALLARVTLDTWPTIVGQPCADPTAIAACLGCVWLTRPPCPVVCRGRAQCVVRSWAPSPIRKNSLQQHHPVWWLIIEKGVSTLSAPLLNDEDVALCQQTNTRYRTFLNECDAACMRFERSSEWAGRPGTGQRTAAVRRSDDSALGLRACCAADTRIVRGRRSPARTSAFIHVRRRRVTGAYRCADYVLKVKNACLHMQLHMH